MAVFTSSLLRVAKVDDVNSAINVAAPRDHITLLDQYDLAELITQTRTASDKIMQMVAEHWADLGSHATGKLKPAVNEVDWKAEKHLLIIPQVLSICLILSI